MKQKGGLVSTAKHIDAVYHVRVVMRDNIMSSDDYHATVTRLSDDTQLVFISDWLWLLNWRTRRKALDRAFNRYDRHKRKLAAIEERVI
jgi:hypothetical protein